MKTVTATLMMLLLAGAALAADPTAEAMALFKRGETLVAQQRYVEAYGEFAAAYRLSGRPLFLFNMGECARAGGDSERARQAYEQYLREDPTGKVAATVRERLGRAAETAMTPAPLAGAATAIVEPAAPPTESPTIRPGAETATTAPPPQSVPTRRSRAAIWAHRPRIAAGLALDSLGIGLAIGGTVAGGLSLSTRSDYDRSCRTSCSPSLYDKGHRFAVASDGLLISAGLVAVTGTLLLLVPRHAPPVDVAVASDGKTTALSIGGRF